MMTANRKLQAEIDRVLKRVAEGVQEFEEIMDKFNAAVNAAQKEKYESELKKTIKKLQRERDQIKTWLTSNDVKDKTVLTEQRKLIEQKMEGFKAVERELKTKAYSREGLNAAAKMDPQEKEKAELGNWISESVDRLSAQVDKYEAEAEQLQASTKKSKKSDSGKVEKLTTLEKQVERHKGHMSKLEIILRMLENGQLGVDDVQGIKEDVDYYIETAENGDYPEDDSFYDDLNLDETEYGQHADEDEEDEDDEGMPSPKETEKPGSGPTSAVGSPQRREEKKPAPAPAPAPAKPVVAAAPAVPIVATPAPAAKPAVPIVAPAAAATPVVAAKPSVQPAATLPPRQPFTAAVRAPAVVPAPPPVVSTAGRGYSAVAAASAAATTTPDSATDDKKVPVRAASGDAAKSPVPAAATPVLPAVRPPSQASAPPAVQIPAAATPSATLPPGTTAAQAVAGQPPVAQPAVPPQTVTSPTPSSVSQASMSPQLSSARPASSSPLPQTPTAGQPPAKPPSDVVVKEEPTPPAQAQEGAENRLPPSLADLVESFEAAKARSTKGTQDTSFAKVMLESSFSFVPDSMDWEKPKNYVPKNPYPTPLYYPQSPPQFLEDPSIFEKFDVDTLFFVFYYQQGTYAQYLAARELKRQSWRFHKKYLTWFQRHEEPKAITDEYEQGTYIYFDYEGAWCQRKKSEFRFEYKFLEDQAD